MWRHDKWLHVLVVVACGFLEAAPAWAQGRNAELLSRFAPFGRRSYNDVWGYSAPNGTEIAILGLAQGVVFVDVTDPRQPLQVGYFQSDATTHRDFRTHEHYAYEVNETGGGLRIYDLSDPVFPEYAGSWDETFDSAHNIGIYDGFAYIVGAAKGGNNAGTRILDLSNPARPVEVGFYNEHYVHDIFVRDDVAYMSTIQRDGFTVVDVSDKSNPREIAYRGYSGASTHNAWLTEDSRHLLTTDETDGGHLRVWTTRGWHETGEWSAHPDASIHNVIVKGDTAYISYYTEGFHALDISDPAFPVPVASYDTWPGASGGFNGAWGVYPFAKSGLIYVSDIASGLYILRLFDGGPLADFDLAAPESQSAIAGQTLLFTFDIFNTAPGDTWFDIAASNPYGWTMTYPDELRLVNNSATAISVLVDVPMDVLGSVNVDVEVCATSRSTGVTLCRSTGVLTPVSLQSFTARQMEQAVVLDWTLDVAPDDSGEIVILRTALASSGTREVRARLPLASDRWLDDDVRPGEAYVYAVAVDNDRGLSLLGERTVHVIAPGSSRLLGNTPNPFNPATRIEFELARPVDVMLRIFDARGRLVRTLPQPTLTAGRHAVLWNGEDRSGNPQTSGVYFYEVRSPEWSARGRMVLLR